MITLKFTFTVQFHAETAEAPPPIVPREEPRPKQSFFDWYEPEESPPAVEAMPADRPAPVQGVLRQLCFAWYQD